jgi:hypothetical protein
MPKLAKALNTWCNPAGDAAVTPGDALTAPGTTLGARLGVTLVLALPPPLLLLRRLLLLLGPRGEVLEVSCSRVVGRGLTTGGRTTGRVGWLSGGVLHKATNYCRGCQFRNQPTIVAGLHCSCSNNWVYSCSYSCSNNFGLHCSCSKPRSASPGSHGGRLGPHPTPPPGPAARPAAGHTAATCCTTTATSSSSCCSRARCSGRGGVPVAEVGGEVEGGVDGGGAAPGIYPRVGALLGEGVGGGQSRKRREGDGVGARVESVGRVTRKTVLQERSQPDCNHHPPKPR